MDSKNFETRSGAIRAWENALREARRVIRACDPDDVGARRDAAHAVRLCESQLRAAEEGLLSEETL